MTSGSVALDVEAVLDGAFARRRDLGNALAAAAEAVARTCHAMADRFRAGGRLLVFGAGVTAVDARHIAVEFLHPVIVGKRALPALAVESDVAWPVDTTASQRFADALRVLGRPTDIAMGLSLDGSCESVTAGLTAARALGLLTVGLTGGAPDALVASAADHAIVLGRHDTLAVREALVTTYHIVWELVHVFLDRPAEGARR